MGLTEGAIINIIIQLANAGLNNLGAISTFTQMVMDRRSRNEPVMAEDAAAAMGHNQEGKKILEDAIAEASED